MDDASKTRYDDEDDFGYEDETEETDETDKDKNDFDTEEDDFGYEKETDETSIVEKSSIVDEILADQYDYQQYDMINIPYKHAIATSQMNEDINRSNNIGINNINVLKSYLRTTKADKNIEKIKDVIEKYRKKIEHLNHATLLSSIELAKTPYKKRQFEELRYSRFLEKLEKEI